MWNLDPGGLEPTRDLPLLSNTGDIRVRHYLINLDVKFRQKIFSGELVIFLEPATEKEKKDGILASHDSVSGIDHSLEIDLGGTGIRCAAVENANNSCKKKEVEEMQAGQNETRSIKENKVLEQDITRNQKDKEENSFLTSSACENDSPGWFTCILDCCDISVEKVEEVNINSSIQSMVSHSEVTPPQSCTHQDINGPEKLQNENFTGSVQNEYLESESKLSKLLGYRRCNYKERNDAFASCLHLPGESLSFKVDTWSLQIWKPGVKSVEDFPAIVRIWYSTKANGRSFTWTFDQAGRECVFSQGAWINNRSLFPCQEPPGAMATWQAYIQAPEEYVVLMSGDELAETKVVSSDGTKTSYYFVNMVMPPSMLALAIGQWHGVNLPADVKNTTEMEDTINITYSHMSISTTCNHEPWPCRINHHQQPVIPARIFAPKSVLASAEDEIGGCIPGYLNAAFKILGPHPFSRLDIVVLPCCFASIGLASPSIVFISQTLLAGDGSLSSRLAHEISHSWFGLLIGAMDWTEEWLSEGFATFLEDPIQSIAENWTKAKFQEISNLRALLRYRALKAEVANTASELQIMRPMGDQSHTRDALLAGYVKNGQHPDKWFLQVHYLKGYFLLHYIADIVSIESLLHVMSTYVSTFHGRLVLSKEFFKILFEMCPILFENHVSQAVIEKDWLDSPGMPSILNHERFSKGNKLIQQVLSEVAKWRLIDSYFRRKEKFKLKKKMKLSFEEPELNLNLLSEQLCLLLEHLLEDERLTSKTLAKLRNDFELHLKNAEIRHRWCELVIRHKFMDGYGDVRMFLLKDQSMGVYLYGELLASEDHIQHLLAETCYEAVAMVMDRGCRRTVEEMMGK